MRLNGDGSVDNTFNASIGGAGAFCVLMQPDAKIVIGGNFTSVNGQPRNFIARLNSNGSLDLAFNPNANSDAENLALQADGKIVVGGSFTTIGGFARNYIARLNPDGSADPGFIADANARTLALALLADGKILFGGDFTTIAGQSRNNLARLSQTDAAVQSLQLSGTTVTWFRSGVGPELELPPELLISNNGFFFSSLGQMVKVAGGWSLTVSSTALPAGRPFYLRTRGRVTSGVRSSPGLIETTREFLQ